MRLIQIAVVSLGVVAWAVPCPAAEGPDIGELRRELQGERPASPRSPEALEAAHAQVIDSIIADLGSDDPGRRGSAQRTIERIAFHAGRPGAEAERAACCRAIAGRLGAAPDARARVWLLRQLERIGRAEAGGGKQPPVALVEVGGAHRAAQGK